MSLLLDIFCIHSGVIIFSCISTYAFIKCISSGDYAEIFEDAEGCISGLDENTEEVNINLDEQK